MNIKSLFLLIAGVFCLRLLNAQDVQKLRSQFVNEQDKLSYLLYEKVEIGVEIPEDIMHSIQVFKRNGRAGINPFNPEQISVEAKFFHESSEELVYGFYYEEFIRDTSDSDSKNWHWHNANTNYPFRVRYAAQQEGNYSCIIRLFIDGKEQYCSDEMRFVVKGSDPLHNGFMKVGKSKNYFVTSNGDFYFPRTQNLYTIECNGCDNYFPLAPKGESLEAYASTTVLPRAFIKFQKDMEEFAAAGGNYFRNIISPWNNAIEFERLNNYFSRLHLAWEMDGIFSKALELNQKIHLDLQIQYALESPAAFSHVFWDWPAGTCDEAVPWYPKDKGNCYGRELNLNSPMEFFTDSLAKMYYKRQLRYIISRWGYSQNIGAIELFSEINNAGSTFEYIIEYGKCYNSGKLLSKPYYDDPKAPTQIYHWHKEMANYIKKELGHRQHLISVSYAGEPSIAKGDSTFFLPEIDINNFNFYSYDRSKGYHTFKQKYGSKTGYYGLQKPFMHSETGLAGFDACCNYTEWIKTVWSSAFSGQAAVAISWDGNFNNPQWHHLNRLKDFIAGYNFDSGEWVSSFQIRNHPVFNAKADELVEVSALQNKSSQQAIGVVMNKTFNYYTMAEAAPCKDSSNAIPSPFNKKQDIVAKKRGRSALDLEGFDKKSEYQIIWWDVLANKEIARTKIKSNRKGEITLVHPPLLLVNGFSPLLAFKIRPFSEN